MSKTERAEPAEEQTPQPSGEPSARELSLRHWRIGWWSLLLFLTLGIVLEALHGFKIDYYLAVDNETRRMMWTLAHAHGVLLSLVHMALAACLWITETPAGKLRKISSLGLTAAVFLLPGGFFLGGVTVHDGDPSMGIFLVPVGAVCLFAAVASVARGLKDAG